MRGTPLFHPSSDLSDYVQDEASDSGGDVSDPGEGTSTPHHVQEGASAREHPSKQRANDVKDVWDHEPLSNQYDRAVDVAPRLLGCGWQGCQSKLASLMLLEKHLRKVHIQGSDATQSASTSKAARKFPCQYGSCANRWFATRDDLMGHVVESHFGQVRLTCPVKACRRVNANRSALRRHLHFVHANDAVFGAFLESAAVAATSMDDRNSLLAPAGFLPAQMTTPLPALPAGSSHLPTYLALLPPIRPTVSTNKRPRPANEESDFDPYFGEFFKEDEPVKQRLRLQLSQQPIRAPENLNQAKLWENVQLTPSLRLKRRDSDMSIGSSSFAPEASSQTFVKVERRLPGTQLCLPRREFGPSPDLSSVTWSRYRAPLVEVEAAVTDVAVSSRAPSVTTLAAQSSRGSSMDPVLVEAAQRRKASSPPGSPRIASPHLLLSLPSEDVEGIGQAASQSTAAPVPLEEPPLAPTIGFQVLENWRKVFDKAVETGAMEKRQDPFLSKPIRGRPKKERAKKRGRPRAE